MFKDFYVFVIVVMIGAFMMYGCSTAPALKDCAKACKKTNIATFEDDEITCRCYEVKRGQ